MKMWKVKFVYVVKVKANTRTKANEKAKLMASLPKESGGYMVEYRCERIS
jgi:hypothetical protein